MKIILFKPEYTEQVKELVIKVLRSLGIGPSDVGISDEDLENIPTIYMTGRSNFWVALEGEQVIGTIAIKELENDTAKLKRMFVAEEFQGSGVAKELLSVAIDFVRKNGYKKIVLNTDKIMHRAHRFYEKNGFKLVKVDDVRRSYELNI